MCDDSLYDRNHVLRKQQGSYIATYYTQPTICMIKIYYYKPILRYKYVATILSFTFVTANIISVYVQCNEVTSSMCSNRL